MTLQAYFFPFARKVLQGTRHTLIGKMASFVTIPLLSGKNFNITYLPINQHITGLQESLLPRTVLERIIRSSAHRAIIRRCTCRDGNRCKNHPVELGCLLLGKGAAEIGNGVSRHVSVSEAIEHAGKCIENGLVPFIGRFRADDFLWGVRNRGKLVTVCFCCPCCCLIQNTVKYLPPLSQDSIVKLKGLHIETDQVLCDGCGRCVSECFIGARRLVDGSLLYDPGLCKGCGRCITICPKQAVFAEVDDVDEAVADLIGRVRELIDYT